jgi:hypothetical protein
MDINSIKEHFIQIHDDRQSAQGIRMSKKSNSNRRRRSRCERMIDLIFVSRMSCRNRHN